MPSNEHLTPFQCAQAILRQSGIWSIFKKSGMNCGIRFSDLRTSIWLEQGLLISHSILMDKADFLEASEWNRRIMWIMSVISTRISSVNTKQRAKQLARRLWHWRASCYPRFSYIPCGQISEARRPLVMLE